MKPQACCSSVESFVNARHIPYVNWTDTECLKEAFRRLEDYKRGWKDGYTAATKTPTQEDSQCPDMQT